MARPSLWSDPRRVPLVAVLVSLLLGWVLPVVGARAAGAVPVTPGFHPIAPSRVMDTRTGLGGATLAAAETRILPIAGTTGVPATGMVAVALNVTVVNPSAPGFLTVWPAGQAAPPTSNLNFVAGEVRANAVVTGVDAAGRIAVRNALGRADVVVDVTGWFSDGFVGVAPTRLLDTRTTTSFGSGETRALNIAGSVVPPVGATAVAVTVTVTNPTAAGFVAAWPDSMPWPGTSTVNFARGDTTATTAIVGLGSGGGISITNVGGTTDVIVDLMGWFSGGFTSVQPSRLLDTRDGTGSCGLYLGGSETRTLTVAGRAGVPASDVGAAVLNLTVTDAEERAGYLTMWPAGAPQPLASKLNYQPGQTVANGVLVGLGAAGQVSIHNEGGPVEVIVDVMGWFPGTTAGGTPAPCPPLMISADLPMPGRPGANGTIATTAFNVAVASLGPTAPVASSPVLLAIAFTGGDRRTMLIRSTPEGESEVPYNVVIDADGFLDDSVAGVHYEVRLVPQSDLTFRVDKATWGYICYRRASPPYSTTLCP